VAPVTAPLSLPGIGKELQRAMLVALKEANISAQPGKADGEGSLGAKLEEVGSGRLRLSLSYRGASSHAVGDLEHLDDLVYAVVAELRPKLLSLAEPQTPAAGTGPDRERQCDPLAKCLEAGRAIWCRWILVDLDHECLGVRCAARFSLNRCWLTAWRSRAVGSRIAEA
jgi:hypothetical protein